MTQLKPDPRVRLITGSDGDEASIVLRLDTATVRVVLPEHPGWHEQVLAITLVDLLGRLFPCIDLPETASPAHPDLPPGPTTLDDRLAVAARNGGLPAAALGAPDITVAVGQAGPADIYTDATGWQTYTGTVAGSLPPAAHQCSAAPVAAAGRAAAAVYSAVLGQIVRLPPFAHGYASLLTYQAGSEPLPEPHLPPPRRVNALLVGAGSVGGAAVHTLAYMPQLDGALIVVDRQHLEPDNRVRAILATAHAADAGIAKAEAARAALAHHASFTVDPHLRDITDWHASRSAREPLPTVLCAVDHQRERRAIQDCLPLVLVNAACGPRAVTVSGHVTGDGPCVCCLHMQDVLDKDNARKRMIAAATGLPEMTVNGLVVNAVPLLSVHLRGIENHRQDPPGSLHRFTGRTLLDLWNEHLLYGAAPATTANGATAAVAAPFTTALAGALLAAEALKHGDAVYEPHRLGPGTVTQYEEDPYAGPANAWLTRRRRWPGSECLCRSVRRGRVATTIYGIPVPATDPQSDEVFEASPNPRFTPGPGRR